MATPSTNHVVTTQLNNGLRVILQEDHSASDRLRLDLVPRRQPK